MLENKTTDDFIFVKQHIYRIFQWMHETPLINVSDSSEPY